MAIPPEKKAKYEAMNMAIARAWQDFRIKFVISDNGSVIAQNPKKHSLDDLFAARKYLLRQYQYEMEIRVPGYKGSPKIKTLKGAYKCGNKVTKPGRKTNTMASLERERRDLENVQKENSHGKELAFLDGKCKMCKNNAPIGCKLPKTMSCRPTPKSF